MFRDGQYLEVIKASDNCLVTAVVTVQEKTVEIKKRKIITNKWLQIEDWAALYKILERAILQNGRHNGSSHHEGRECEWRKSTRQLEVTYTFEHPECTSDTTLPTIKVHVSPARNRSVKQEANDEVSKVSKVKTRDDTTKRTKEDKFSDRTTTTSNQLKRKSEKSAQKPSLKKIDAPRVVPIETEALKKKKKRKYDLLDDLKNVPLEEYIPDAPKTKKLCMDLKYIPSQKSTLESMPLATNEYTPTLCDSKYVPEDVNYVPNSIEKLVTYEIYEPCAITTIPNNILKEYIPNSKGIKPSVEEYEPDFRSPNKLMKFDDSYVPSSVRRSVSNDFRRIPENKSEKLKKIEAHRKGAVSKRKMDLF